jgi:hypothetical protein
MGVDRQGPNEVTAAAWFKPDELPRELAFPGHIIPVLNAWRRAFLAGDLVSSLPDRPSTARR